MLGFLIMCIFYASCITFFVLHLLYMQRIGCWRNGVCVLFGCFQLKITL